MTQIDIVAGLLGAGKTTMIHCILEQCYIGKKVAIIENECGKIGIDAAQFAGKKVHVREITSGCICCTLKMNLVEGIREIVSQYHPEYIILEPSGIASLKDMVSICSYLPDTELHMVLTLVNGQKFDTYQKIFGSFFKEQIEHSRLIYVNRMKSMRVEEQEDVVRNIRKWNAYCPIIIDAWDTFDFRLLIELAQEIKGNFEEKQIKVKQNAIQMHSAGKHSYHNLNYKEYLQRKTIQNIETWTYQFHRLLTQKQVEEIGQLLLSQKCGEVFRGKGILKCENGNAIIANYVFGETSVMNFQSGIPISNEYIVIGQNLHVHILEQEFRRLEEQVNGMNILQKL